MFLGFLLPLGFCLLTFDLLRRRLGSDTGLRELLLFTALVFGLAVVLGTELLNLCRWLTTPGAFLFWGAACLGLHLLRRRLPPAPPLDLSFRARELYRESSFVDLALLLVVAVFVSVLLAIGLFATPNNYDSMTYHLARVAHWRQDQSIEFYGTNIPRQNFMPPWSEWLMLHLTLLQGDDGLVNLVQGFSYLACIVGASLLAEQIGGGRRAGILAAFFVATLPMAVLEATTTQNDLVMTFWLIGVIYGCFRLFRAPDWTGTLVFGASLGLGVLSKSLVTVFAAPFALCVVWFLMRRGLKIAFPRLAIIGLLALGLNAGHFTRNWMASGALLGPPEHDKVGSLYFNDIHTPGAIFSNILRNLSLHANVFHEKDAAEAWVIAVHRALGLDPSDPHTTFNGATYCIWEGGEDGTPMLVHLLVIALSYLAVLTIWRRVGTLGALLAGCVLVDAFLFCFLLKWSQFHARPHLVLFILAAPVTGLALRETFLKWIRYLFLLLFLLGTAPIVFYESIRPALGPVSVFVTPGDFQQYILQRAMKMRYEAALKILDANQVESVGLIWGEDDWEYPLLTVDRQPVPWRVDHVLIENSYARLETNRVPGALLCARPGFGDKVTVHGQEYSRVFGVVDRGSQAVIFSVYWPSNVPFVAPPQSPSR